MFDRTPLSTSTRKWCVALITCCSVLAVACSDSGSESSTGEPADDRSSELAADDSAAADGEDVPAGDPATDDPATDDAAAGGADTDEGDVANAAVCDLVGPMADSVVEAFSFGFMTSDGHHGRSSRCEFAVVGEPPGAGYELEAYVAVERLPAVITDVATAAESFDVGGSSTPASSVGDDAVLVTDGVGDMAVVVFAAGGRVWSVQGHSPWEGIESPPGVSVDEATVEVARIVRSGLG